MFKTLKPFILLLGASFALTQAHAQRTYKSEDDRSNDQNIIIHKKDSSKEKITVVIDGNDITVNGKPVDDFKSDDVDIIKQDMDVDIDNFAFADGTMPAIAPRPPKMDAFKYDMLRKIKSNEAFLGVMTEKDEKGAQITEITKGSAAEKAGLKEDDIITKIGDDKVTGPDDLYKAVGKHKPDEKVTITYLRDGKQLTANATFGKAEKMKIYSWNTPDNHFDLKDLTPFNYSFGWGDKPRLGIEAQDTEDENGVKVLSVEDEEDSPAAKAGLKQDDVITQINGKAIKSTDDLKESMKDVKKGDTLKVTYKRNNQTQTVDVKFPKDLKTIDL